jgi:hypothetical protein
MQSVAKEYGGAEAPLFGIFVDLYSFQLFPAARRMSPRGRKAKHCHGAA